MLKEHSRFSIILYFKLKNMFFLRIYLFALHGIFSCGMQTLSCSTWDLVPRSGVEPSPPALGAWCLSHWTTREISYLEFSWAVPRAIGGSLSCHICYGVWELEKVIVLATAWPPSVHGEEWAEAHGPSEAGTDGGCGRDSERWREASRTEERLRGAGSPVHASSLHMNLQVANFQRRGCVFACPVR